MATWTGSIAVPTDRDAFILSTRGSIVSVLPGTNKKPIKANPVASRLIIEAGEKGKSLAKLRFGIPLMRSNLKNLTKVV